MSLMRAMEITATGLFASRARMNVAASNLANAQTTRTAEGGPYRRKNVVLGSRQVAGSETLPVGVGSTFGKQLQQRIADSLRSVEVVSVSDDGRPLRTVYDPGHPDADKNGVVKLPNVNMVEEMVDMITSSRAYEAGVSTMSTIKAMADRALRIGK